MRADAELTNAVSDMNDSIPHSKGRKLPFIPVSTVGLIDDSHAVCLKNPEFLKSAASWYDMSFIAVRQDHADAEPDQPVFSLLHGDFLCAAQIDPV